MSWRIQWTLRKIGVIIQKYFATGTGSPGQEQRCQRWCLILATIKPMLWPVLGKSGPGHWTVGPRAQGPTCQEPYWALAVFKEAPCLSCVQILVRKRDKSFNFEATLPRARMLCFIVSIVPDLVTPTSSPLFEMTIALGIKISLSNFPTIIKFECRPIITHTQIKFSPQI